MPTDKIDDEQIFFGEMDQKKAHQSCCTCQTMGLLFGLILILTSFGLIYIYWQITRIKVSSFSLPDTNIIQQVSSKFSDIISQKSQTIEFNINDSELTTTFSSGLSLSSFALKDIQTQIMPGNVLIYGSLFKPLKSKVVISAVPKVKDSKIYLETTGITAGNLNIPKFLYNQINMALNSSLDNKFVLLYQVYNIDEVSSEEGKMVVKGKIK
jgi:hypothetical protein